MGKAKTSMANMNYTVLITGKLIADEAVQLLLDHGIKPVASDPDHQNLPLLELIKLIQPDGIIVRTGRLDADLIGSATALKVIAKHGVGVDMIDIDAASKRGIPVMITPGANARSVAEHALALTLNVLKDIPGLNSRLAEGAWEKAVHRGRELTGKHIGLIGYGRIAQNFAALLEPFGVKILVYTRTPPAKNTHTRHAFTSSLSELLAHSDIVSLHCPLNDQTNLLLGRTEIAQLKRGAIIINTARGELLDEDALLEALQTGQIAGAGLDCFTSEPPLPSNKLINHPRVITTPHIAWATNEASRNMGLVAAQNIIAALQGDELAHPHTINAAGVSKLPAHQD